MGCRRLHAHWHCTPTASTAGDGNILESAHSRVSLLDRVLVRDRLFNSVWATSWPRDSIAVYTHGSRAGYKNGISKSKKYTKHLTRPFNDNVLRDLRL